MLISELRQQVFAALIFIWIKRDSEFAPDIITHKLSLADAPRAYDIFDKKEDSNIKVKLKP